MNEPDEGQIYDDGVKEGIRAERERLLAVIQEKIEKKEQSNDTIVELLEIAERIKKGV